MLLEAPWANVGGQEIAAAGAQAVDWDDPNERSGTSP
jgi:hypothetical protein